MLFLCCHFIQKSFQGRWLNSDWTIMRKAVQGPFSLNKSLLEPVLLSNKSKRGFRLTGITTQPSKSNVQIISQPTWILTENVLRHIRPRFVAAPEMASHRYPRVYYETSVLVADANWPFAAVCDGDCCVASVGSPLGPYSTSIPRTQWIVVL